MKQVYIASIGAISLMMAAPLIGQIPGVTSLFQLESATAQNTKNQSQLQLQLVAEKQVETQDQQGNKIKKWEALKNQAVVKPGDVLLYTLKGENKSDRQLKNLTLNQPIPKQMSYVLKSINTSSNTTITYSIDGGRTFVKNPTIKVTLPNGTVETKPAPATAYTNIRLQVPTIAAKTTFKATYQTQVR
ncbi:hypothetical protein H6G54_06140 [Anabaena cylindrica FACHB-243]|uniref:Conserved repeat domain protein n=1 Tax=Anabaena cylindrica (strain ATCC 27899 / PCC 7122) TaxID=272123 RepID=K9ZH23_ANACC|nr:MULTISPECIES: hypothetical protein [Anabaena]AFZ58486.1 conserved repeat domain protein [Anabaena cylindrica PCC 7122]MBD2417293.1 hypothetical protein [Anabaena cylindrica FACHB-243]MBY5281414.1 hypothetical protein [Anabaena sp. CCAP 1446/1C]MBY5310195.1 hypothetical protein [Anabaena sp. CCAP 1446/1C]MCM2410016.1 hypothetical protein [Anabaena sp. CCAP 1446/1C]